MADTKTLNGIKQTALSAIDQKAEDARLRHLTLGSGQAQVYFEKAEEASDFLAADIKINTPLNKLDDYPYIVAEAEVTKRKARDVAEDIINARAKWIKTSTQIERIRLGAKQQIRQAQTTKDVEDICRKAVEELALI